MSDAPASSKRPPKHTTIDSARETIDSIVVALILAFVFRAFIVEAFVIPTGSMAATLNGAHGTMVCTNCGWEFTYGLIDPANSPRRDLHFRPPPDPEVVCQNCRFPNRAVEINDAKGNFESGDRILVLKWPFDLGGPALGPQRWDVIVFKNPSDGVTNYIKRLIGTPGEVLQIIDGDVYSVPTAKLSEDTVQTLQDLIRIKHWRMHYERREDSTRQRLAKSVAVEPDLPDRETLESERKRLLPRLEAALDELDGKLQVRRKTRLAQDALWTVLYDHNYPPIERGPEQPYWRPAGDEWSVGTRTLRYDGLNSSRQSVELICLQDSFCAYNSSVPEPPSSRTGNLYPVSDLRVRFVVDYAEGDGSLAVRLRKRDDVFVGELSADGALRLDHAMVQDARVGELKTLSSTRIDPLSAGNKFEFAMQNVDHRVSILIDGREVLATTDELYAPDIGAIRLTPSPTGFAPVMSAENIVVELSHVVVDKDVYYIDQIAAGYRPLGMDGWGTRNFPILLRDWEYFFLGDNSAQSQDSRLWHEVGEHLVIRGEDFQLGTVPRDQLIGRAFFVYWPSGLRTRLIPMFKDRGWIPNFGRMRWIR